VEKATICVPAHGHTSICRVMTDKKYPGGKDCEKIGNCGTGFGVKVFRVMEGS
jgi:hypothetical protein